jgi:phosphohistidine swiveling domain-containing protein
LWFSDHRDVDRIGLEVARRLTTSGDPLTRAYEEYSAVVRKLHTIEAEPIDWMNFTRGQLVIRFRELSTLIQQFWQWAILPESAGYGIAAYFQKELPSILSPASVQEALTVLTSPDSYSFFQQEELVLLRLMQAGTINDEKLTNHTENYAWLLGNYASNAPLEPLYFRNRSETILASGEAPSKLIDEIEQRLERTNRRRSQIVDQLSDGELKKLASQAGFFVRWHDDRKSEQLRFQLILHQLLAAASRALNVPFDNLLYWTEDEVMAALQGDVSVSAELIVARQTLSLGWVSKDGEPLLLVGPDVEKIYDEYHALPATARSVELHGTVASSGSGELVRSLVRILHHPSDGHRLQPGEILVASMTSPEFIDAIRKAGAIVTDVGGLTSHAAVVARELNIPCIVGTKHATKVLKDGDLVEVDATNGVVRRIDG